MSKPTKGCIILLQNYLDRTTVKRAKELLRKYYAGAYELEFEAVEILPYAGKIIDSREINEIRWKREAAHQKRIIEEEFKPKMTTYADYDIHYFGSAPIALCIHLGWLISTWKKVNVWLKRHTQNKEWYWNDLQELGEETLMTRTPISMGVPKEENNTKDDILIKVESSYRAEDEEFKQSISDQINLAKVIQITYDQIELDLPNVQLAYQLGDAFGEALNQVSNQLKKVRTIHLLGLVPNAVGFLMGTHLSANIHQPIQTYQYDNRLENSKYLPAILIGDNNAEMRELNEEERAEARMIKKQHEEEWHRLEDWVEKNAEAKAENKTWYEAILPKGIYTHYFENHIWKYLPHLCDTYLDGAGFDVVAEPETDFGFAIGGKDWRLSDEMVHAIYRRFIRTERTEQVQQALRLLLFHEVMHEKQGIMGWLAAGIGKFPKILEVADYQADVWAILHEFYYARTHYRHKMGDKQDPSNFFVQLIDSAINTMWAFDDQGMDLTQLPIRRLNRYLIWYWQRARVVHRHCNSLENILAILTELPILEIKGLNPRTEKHRVFYSLQHIDVCAANLELGVLLQHRVKRTGNLESFNIVELLQSFKERNHQNILRQITVLHNLLYDQYY